jgi:hypothetical protein
MAQVNISIIAGSDDIAALVALGAEVSSAIDGWIERSREFDIEVDDVIVLYENIPEEDN